MSLPTAPWVVRLIGQTTAVKGLLHRGLTPLLLPSISNRCIFHEYSYNSEGELPDCAVGGAAGLQTSGGRDCLLHESEMRPSDYDRPFSSSLAPPSTFRMTKANALVNLLSDHILQHYSPQSALRKTSSPPHGGFILPSPTTSSNDSNIANI